MKPRLDCANAAPQPSPCRSHSDRASPGPHRIALASENYTLTLVGSDDTGLGGDLDILTNIEIIGSAANPTIIQASTTGPDTAIGRIFDVRPGATLTLSHVTIQHGRPTAATVGGGILNAGTVALDRVVVRNNRADTGGGIRSAGVLTVTNSTIDGNASTATTGAGGGGLLNQAGIARLDNVTVSRNVATTTGGGIAQFATSGSMVLLSNVSVIGNTAFSAGAGGGGIRSVTPGSVRLKNSIVANNLSPNLVGFENCSESGSTLASVSDGFNLLYPTSSSSFGRCRIGDGPGDIVGQDPLLGPLRDNGGVGGRPTHALLVGSPAIDGGNPAGCNDGAGVVLTIDERGLRRPRDGNADGANRCDIGAYELQDPFPADLQVTMLQPDDPVVLGELITYTVRVTNAGPSTATGVTFIVDLPSNFTIGFFSGTSPFSCTREGNTFTCAFGTMASGSVRTATFQGRPTTTSKLLATTRVSAQQPDPNQDDNLAGTSTSVIDACEPRLRVNLSVVPDGPGRLRATLTAGPSSQVADNRIRTVRITRLDNAEVDIGQTFLNARVGTDFVIPDSPRSVILTVRRKAAGPFTTQVAVSDRCGAWQTLVGGGQRVP